MAKRGKTEVRMSSNQIEIVKRVDKYFGFGDHLSASDMLLEKVLENDFSLYEGFKDEVADSRLVDGKMSIEYDYLRDWYEFYLTNPNKGQYFTPPSLSKLLAKITIKEHKYDLKLKKSAEILKEYAQKHNKLNSNIEKDLNYIIESKKYDLIPLIHTEMLRKIGEIIGCKEHLKYIKLPLRAYDMACGTGSLIIDNWFNYIFQFKPFNYSPLTYIACLQDVSKHVIPFCLFNMAFRGIQSFIIHGDTLTGEIWDIYTVTPTLEDIERNTMLPFGKVIKHDIRNSDIIERVYKVGFFFEGYLKPSARIYNQYLLDCKKLK